MFGRIDELLSARTYCGKPTQILAEIWHNLPNISDTTRYEEIVRRLWSRNLPEPTRGAVTMDKSLDEAATIADTVYEV